MEVQRFTKYPLLLENIAKYTGDGCSAEPAGSTSNGSEDVASWQEAHQPRPSERAVKVTKVEEF